MDDIISNLPKNQKFNAQQLRGYLTKKGVSPKEIEASGILEPYLNDSRAFTAEEWEIMNSEYGKHRFNIREIGDSPVGNLGRYSNVSLNKKGVETDTYKERLFTSNKQKEDTNLRHFSNEIEDTQSLLGWNRIHQDNINGKNTTVLNEFQSDWLQAERQGAGVFKSNIRSIKPLPDDVQSMIKAEGLTNEEIADADYFADRLMTWAEQGLITQSSVKSNPNIIADFPMKPEKFHQLMIVDAINVAIKNGTKRVAIPIERENELAGTAGVTKFYDNLNKSILPDIRKKLEKQGLRIKLSKEAYKNKDKKSGATYKNTLHIIEIEEIPNKRIKWDVYAVLSALGLEKYVNKEES
jgi:hypothetical protein